MKFERLFEFSNFRKFYTLKGLRGGQNRPQQEILFKSKNKRYYMVPYAQKGSLAPFFGKTERFLLKKILKIFSKNLHP